jgi:threonine/homoserine/homoserine lactone efflux protein
VAIFFLAFLPQFVEPDGGAVALQVLVLGLCFTAVAIISDGCYALAAGSLGTRLRGSAGLRRRLDRASAVVYLALGFGAAVSGERPRS